MKTSLLFLFLAAAIPCATAAPSAVHLNISGSGAPMLCLPGFVPPGDGWNDIVNQFPDHQACVVTYAGFGGAAPLEMPWYDTSKSQLEDYIRSYNLTKLSGWSLPANRFGASE